MGCLILFPSNWLTRHMRAVEMNTIEASDLTYPEKPDAHGGARRYFKRKAYYFGPHNSPDSFVLFGEWKRQLIESGSASDVKLIRKDLVRAAKSVSDRPSRAAPFQWQTIVGFAAIFLLMMATVLVGVKFLSSPPVPVVDGVAMTEDEINILRGVRIHNTGRTNRIDARAKRTAELTNKLMEEGLASGKLHSGGQGS